MIQHNREVILDFEVSRACFVAHKLHFAVSGASFVVPKLH